MYLPMSEKSSTKMTSFSRWGGDRSMMLCTVRKSTDQASLWKHTTTLVSGRLSLYFRSLHLQIIHQLLVNTNQNLFFFFLALFGFIFYKVDKVIKINLISSVIFILSSMKLVNINFQKLHLKLNMIPFCETNDYRLNKFEITLTKHPLIVWQKYR